ncbi:helix-turn-helix domain-containing protein [Deinococcus radiopugnans]|uniref:Uncharacterized protein n=1 Tax=Deinococcus radiopugnans ATCC 19172 TaxID=585398 RepID=A0A5C4Y431_9DEIO|nr:helix-turn-helix domain-containing protein [Deinococcus radiopugnans]MBB6017162.1 hypothetical protein [Deinococcus radiopugnans ATCC 19172]TNM70617.1 hypothetical protein FHR04_11980 [Deinococcus radiopugnans ATCC 19172]
MKRLFTGPEHWLTYVTRHLAPFEREEAQAPFRAKVARWREEGLSNAEIVARLGDAEETAAALSRRFVRLDEEASLRNQLTESPWWVLFGSLILLGLSLLIEHSKKGQVTAWNALIPTCGLLISLSLLWARPHLPPRWWLALSPSGAWTAPLVFIVLMVRAEEFPLWALSWALGLGVLSVGARFVLLDRNKLAKLERLARHGSPRLAP